MMLSRYVTALTILLSQVKAQSNPMPCSCPALFQESVQKVSSIYAGFDDKVTSATQRQYNQLLERLKIKSAKAANERECYEIIRQYTGWFKDNHVGIWFGIKSSPAELRKVDLNKITRASVISPGSPEGTWWTIDKKQQYTIIKDPSGNNKFIAITVTSTDSAWKPGMVKAEFYRYEPKPGFYRAMYYQKDFTGVLNGFTLSGNRLDHWFGPSWFRDNLAGTHEVTTKTPEPVQFKVVNKDFVYLKLGKFNPAEVHQFDSLVKLNRSIIFGTRNLIIDLRGNPGGYSGTSQAMLQLIYTNPVIYPSWQLRSSPELIESIKQEVAGLSKNDPYNRLKSQQSLLERLIENPEKLVSSGDSIVRRLDSISRYPERVAVLIDKGSGSSAEFFVFESKQSKKTRLFGTNTFGVMDYGDASQVRLSCGNYVLSIARGRNGWIERFGFRIDNTGFKPDVLIPSTEKDWIQFVVNYWSK
jgi:hypothetical protein